MEALKYQYTDKKDVWFCEVGEHTFTIHKLYAPGMPNMKGYRIHHSGPRYEVPAQRKAKRRRVGETPIDDNVQMNRHLINRQGDTRAHIQMFLIQQEEAKATLLTSKSKSAKSKTLVDAA